MVTALEEQPAALRQSQIAEDLQVNHEALRLTATHLSTAP
jgi:hypothetical protein